jgi:carbohydrate kinase (thermoresistant glucokinase family)
VNVVILMGPMGCGKTTIGKLLAEKTGYDFADADDYHPEENRLKMGKGIPLDDNDREPWLHLLHQLICDHLFADKPLILACSALKKKYRDALGIDQKRVFSVFLKGSYELLKERIERRAHEYMEKGLLQSQLDTLEEPESGLVVDISETPEQICRKIIEQITH